MSDTEKDNFKIGESQMTLAEIAGLDFEDVQERRGFAFPKGFYVWEVDGEKPPHREITEQQQLIVPYSLKCIDVIEVKDDTFTDDPQTLIGKLHRETFFITNEESIGYLKAFRVDIGAAPKGKFNDETLAQDVGLRFQAGISKRKDKNDSDKIYTSISRQKIVPLGSAAASDVAKAVS